MDDVLYVVDDLSGLPLIEAYAITETNEKGWKVRKGEYFKYPIIASVDCASTDPKSAIQLYVERQRSLIEHFNNKIKSAERCIEVAESL